MKAAWVIFIDSRTGKILILKRSKKVRNPGQWCFPGGSAKKVKAKKLAKQEVFEEVGLVNIRKLIAILKVVTRSKRYYFYLKIVDKDKLDIKINHESVKYKWVKMERIQEIYRLHRSIRIFIKNYKNGEKIFKTKTAFRSRKVTPKRLQKGLGRKGK